MALFQKTKETTEGSLPAPRPQAALAVPGEAAAECMRVGQILVEGEQLSAENLAIGLSVANGDLLQFADTVLGRFAVDRVAVAAAIAEEWAAAGYLRCAYNACAACSQLAPSKRRSG